MVAFNLRFPFLGCCYCGQWMGRPKESYQRPVSIKQHGSLGNLRLTSFWYFRALALFSNDLSKKPCFDCTLQVAEFSTGSDCDSGWGHVQVRDVPERSLGWLRSCGFPFS